MGTLADAKLQWQQCNISKKGLDRLASRAAEELGSYEPGQLGELANAFAGLLFDHSDFMQSLSRAVEFTAQHSRGHFANDGVCRVVEAYRMMGVLDVNVMKLLSRMICRRLVREPFTPHQTVRLAIAFAELRARDKALFNATTLALTKRNVVESLGWQDLADTLACFASLRFFSSSLFSRARRRLCDSAGLLAGTVDVNFSTPQITEGGCPTVAALPRALPSLKEQLCDSPPPAPPIQLKTQVVAKFLESHVRFNSLGAEDLAPLLPHLTHPDDARMPSELAALLVVALSCGGHVWPWLWQRAVPAFDDKRLAGRNLLSLTDSIRAHLSLLEPLLRNQKRPRRTASAAQASLSDHVRVVCGILVKLWNCLSGRCRGMPDLDLQHITVAALNLHALQSALVERSGRASQGGAAVQYASSEFVRHLGFERHRRRAGAWKCNLQYAELAFRCGVTAALVDDDIRSVESDSITAD